MVVPRSLGYETEKKRRVLMMNLGALDTPFTLPRTNGRHFSCLCVMDARPLKDSEIGTFCLRLIKLGCAFLSTWGPDCERVHDAMDEETLGQELFASEPDAGVLMTSWHAKESLEEALAFLLYCSVPDETFAPKGCAVDLIITVGSSQWNAAIERYVAKEIGPVPRRKRSRRKRVAKRRP